MASTAATDAVSATAAGVGCASRANAAPFSHASQGLVDRFEEAEHATSERGEAFIGGEGVEVLKELRQLLGSG